MRQEKLEQIIDMIPIMKNMVDEDMAISVWDTEGTVLYFNKAETFQLHLEVGYKHPDKNDKIFEAMSTGKTIHNILPKEVFGVSIEGNLVPVFDDGKVVGCIVSVFSVEKKHELKKQNEVIKEIYSSVENLEKSVNGVYGVVEAIKGNTSSIKMLALNASIEAARAGEAGKGFAVVATEIGQLAEQSSSTINDINVIVEEVNNSVGTLTNCLMQLLDLLDKKVTKDYNDFTNSCNEYSSSNNEIEKFMLEANNEANALKKSVEEITMTMEGIESTIKESADGVSNIAEKTYDVVEQTNKTYELTENCMKSANALEEIIARFKL